MRKSTGFTLLEVIIVVAIGSVLAAVGINTYQKYIAKSKINEGLIMLRKIVDAEVLFASNPVYTTQSGEVCSFYENFVGVSMYHFDEGDGYIQAYNNRPPKGIKSMTRAFFGETTSRNYMTVNPSGQCSYTDRVPFGYNASSDLPWVLGLAEPVGDFAGGQNHQYGAYLEPGYFLYFAGKNYQYAAETGDSGAIMVYAIGDLDGVRPDSSYANLFSWHWTNEFLSRYPFYTVMARGVHINSNGEPEAAPGIYILNEQEYDEAVYGGSSSGSYY